MSEFLLEKKTGRARRTNSNYIRGICLIGSNSEVKNSGFGFVYGKTKKNDKKNYFKFSRQRYHDSFIWIWVNVLNMNEFFHHQNSFLRWRELLCEKKKKETLMCLRYGIVQASNKWQFLWSRLCKLHRRCTLKEWNSTIVVKLHKSVFCLIIAAANVKV